MQGSYSLVNLIRILIRPPYLYPDYGNDIWPKIRDLYPDYRYPHAQNLKFYPDFGTAS